jgi:hypothetical protein
MINHLRVGHVVLVILLAGQGLVTAGITQSGDLYTIVDPVNPSDGLRFLEANYTYSVGLSKVNALIAARAVYPNARVATPSEINDLFDAAVITYDAGWTAGDAFTSGTDTVISSGMNYNSEIYDLWDTYFPPEEVKFWSDPDGSSLSTSTRDVLLLTTTSATIVQSSINHQTLYHGWLLVSEAPTSTPAPGALCLALTGVMSAAGFYRRRRLA